MSLHRLVPAPASEHPVLLALPLTREELTKLGVEIPAGWTPPEHSTDAREGLFVSAYLGEVSGLGPWTQNRLDRILDPAMTPTLRATAARLRVTVETTSRLESDIMKTAWSALERILPEAEIVRRLCVKIESLTGVSPETHETCNKSKLLRAGHIAVLGEVFLTQTGLTMGQIRELRRALAELGLTTGMTLGSAVMTAFERSLRE